MKHARKLLICFLLSLLTLAFSASAWAFCGNGQGYYCKDYRYPCAVSDICEPGMYCLRNVLTQQALAQQAAIDTPTTTSTAVIADEVAPMTAINPTTVSDDYYAYQQPAPMPCQSYQYYGGHHGGGHHSRHH